MFIPIGSSQVQAFSAQNNTVLERENIANANALQHENPMLINFNVSPSIGVSIASEFQPANNSPISSQLFFELPALLKHGKGNGKGIVTGDKFTKKKRVKKSKRIQSFILTLKDSRYPELDLMGTISQNSAFPFLRGILLKKFHIFKIQVADIEDTIMASIVDIAENHKEIERKREAKGKTKKGLKMRENYRKKYGKEYIPSPVFSVKFLLSFCDYRLQNLVRSIQKTRSRSVNLDFVANKIPSGDYGLIESCASFNPVVNDLVSSYCNIKRVGLKSYATIQGISKKMVYRELQNLKRKIKQLCK